MGVRQYELHKDAVRFKCDNTHQVSKTVPGMPHTFEKHQLLLLLLLLLHVHLNLFCELKAVLQVNIS